MRKTLLAAALLAASAAAVAAPRVASSIYPLQQIANAIVGQPTELINDSYQSPHHYAVKPDDAKKIADADILLWVGPVLMPQLDAFVDRRSADKITLTALELANMKLLKSDHKHDHGEHGHDEHDEHEEHEKHGKHEEHEEHEGHDEHGHEDFGKDPHVWLSTYNAGVIAKALADNLSRLDKANAAVYEKNLQAFLAELQATKSDIIGNFESNPAQNYFVFHNAYAYFENEFGVKHAGVVTMHGGQAPKAGLLAELKTKLKNTPNACIFREPQFDSKIVKRLAEGTKANTAVLDPIGYEKGKNIGYSTILRNVANQISTCGK